MFTGIITHIAIINDLNFYSNNDLLITLVLVNKSTNRNLKIGCSIGCDGVCLTLIKKESNSLFFQASNETLKKTNVKNWKIGNRVNIEFALKIGDELGGNLVSGHIDDVALVQRIEAINNDSWLFSIQLKEDLRKFIVPKGSVVLNGVSLTINEVLKNSFNVNIIKHTFENTNFADLNVGNYLNLEIDLIARYLENFTKLLDTHKS
jgi:riboflavin synthase